MYPALQECIYEQSCTTKADVKNLQSQFYSGVHEYEKKWETVGRIVSHHMAKTFMP